MGSGGSLKRGSAWRRPTIGAAAYEPDYFYFGSVLEFGVPRWFADNLAI